VVHFGTEGGLDAYTGGLEVSFRSEDEGAAHQVRRRLAIAKALRPYGPFRTLRCPTR